MFSVLPPQEHSFSIDVVGTKSGQTFQGSFTYSRPTLGLSIEIGKTKAHMLGGAPVFSTDALTCINSSIFFSYIRAVC
jgi:hypothetical protein